MDPTKITFLLSSELNKDLEQVLERCHINRTEMMNKSLESGLAYITSKETPTDPSPHLHFWRDLYHRHRDADK